MLNGILNLLDPLNGEHKPERPGICEAFCCYFFPIASCQLAQGASDPLVIVLIGPPPPPSEKEAEGGAGNPSLLG